MESLSDGFSRFGLAPDVRSHLIVFEPPVSLRRYGSDTGHLGYALNRRLQDRRSLIGGQRVAVAWRMLLVSEPLAGAGHSRDPRADREVGTPECWVP